MSPSERRDVRQQLGRTVQSFMLSLRDGVSEMLGVPIDDDGGEQVQTCHAEVLTFGGPVTDFALAANPEGVFQGVVSLPFVQPNLCATRAMSASRSQSMMKSVRSTRPISRSATASSCWRG